MAAKYTCGLPSSVKRLRLIYLISMEWAGLYCL